jgi:hypothetical protein
MLHTNLKLNWQINILEVTKQIEFMPAFFLHYGFGDVDD